LLEHSLCFKYMITIVNSVSVIKVKIIDLIYIDFFTQIGQLSLK